MLGFTHRVETVNLENQSIFMVREVDTGKECVWDANKPNEALLIIRSLMEERAVVLDLLKESHRGQVRLIKNNEFQRMIHDAGGKIGADPKCIRMIIEPIIRQMAEEMLAPPSKKKRGAVVEDGIGLDGY